MSEKQPQTFSNHARIDPGYHYVILPVLVLCFLISLYLAIRGKRDHHILLPVLSVTVLLLAVYCRSYALKVQNRVIRLEERLRLTALLPESLQPRIHSLSERQLIALRFASDDELPSLAERTLQENLEPKAIKKAINKWRPDYLRV